MSISNTIRNSTVAIQASSLSRNVQKLIFGVGSHRWPNSRESAGLRCVNAFSNRLGWRWARLARAQCDVAQRSGVLLARPLTYIRSENARAYNLLSQLITVEAKNVIIVVGDMDQEPGQLHFGPATSRLAEYMEEFAPNLLPEQCEHLSIGIGRPQIRGEVMPPVALQTDDDQIQRMYLANTFSQDSERLVTSAIERGLEILKRQTGQ